MSSKLINCKHCGQTFAHERKEGQRGRSPLYCEEHRSKKKVGTPNGEEWPNIVSRVMDRILPHQD